MLVDWLKHAFIPKFNHIRLSIYERYMTVFAVALPEGVMSVAGGHAQGTSFDFVSSSGLTQLRKFFVVYSMDTLTSLHLSPEDSALPHSY